MGPSAGSTMWQTTESVFREHTIKDQSLISMIYCPWNNIKAHRPLLALAPISTSTKVPVPAVKLLRCSDQLPRSSDHVKNASSWSSSCHDLGLDRPVSALSKSLQRFSKQSSSISSKILHLFFFPFFFSFSFLFIYLILAFLLHVVANVICSFLVSR